MPIPSLPQEMIDHIIDFLHDDSVTLNRCCLVSRSWIKPTRTHIFNYVCFTRDLSQWKKNFPDLANSPAEYTRTLCFLQTECVTESDLNWIGSFKKVLRLEAHTQTSGESREPGSQGFPPFHSLLPAVRSLSVGWKVLRSQEVLDFICSFSHLEDLHVTSAGRIDDEDVAISRSPLLNGTFVLDTITADVAHQLSKLHGGCRFRRIVQKGGFISMRQFNEMRDLVERCSSTLEYIYIVCQSFIDFSDAKKLVEVKFAFHGYQITLVTEILGTITASHVDFKRVLIHLPFNYRELRECIVEEWPRLRWMDLDRVLVKLWEWHSIRVKTIWRDEGGNEVEVTDEHIGCYLKYLLPEMAARGGIEVELTV